MVNVLLVVINVICNIIRDRFSDIIFIIVMCIENVLGVDIISFVNVIFYNMFINICGEFVFIYWSEVFFYCLDLNGLNLICYVEINSK